MQKINNKDGITLIALVITISVLLILLSIVVYNGLSNVKHVVNNKLEIELALVQNAVIQQYTMAKTKGDLNVKVDNSMINNMDSNSIGIKKDDDINRPESFVGTRIYNIDKLNENGFEDYLINNIDEMINYEDYYYLLTAEDLEEIGIEGTEQYEKGQKPSYIVNYATGEVFDVIKKEYYNENTNLDNEKIYLEGTDSKIKEKEYDFTDN